MFLKLVSCTQVSFKCPLAASCSSGDASWLLIAVRPVNQARPRPVPQPLPGGEMMPELWVKPFWWVKVNDGNRKVTQRGTYTVSQWKGGPLTYEVPQASFLGSLTPTPPCPRRQKKGRVSLCCGIGYSERQWKTHIPALIFLLGNVHSLQGTPPWVWGWGVA